MPHIMWTNDLEVWRVCLCNLDQTGNLKDECMYTFNFHTNSITTCIPSDKSCFGLYVTLQTLSLFLSCKGTSHV